MHKLLKMIFNPEKERRGFLIDENFPAYLRYHIII